MNTVNAPLVLWEGLRWVEPCLLCLFSLLCCNLAASAGPPFTQGSRRVSALMVKRWALLDMRPMGTVRSYFMWRSVVNVGGRRGVNKHTHAHMFRGELNWSCKWTEVQLWHRRRLKKSVVQNRIICVLIIPYFMSASPAFRLTRCCLKRFSLRSFDPSPPVDVRRRVAAGSFGPLGTTQNSCDTVKYSLISACCCALMNCVVECNSTQRFPLEIMFKDV